MESLIEDLKSQVQCFLCNETMNEPKLLQCFHTFCKRCIKTNAQLDGTDGQVNVFKCPQCSSQTMLQQLNDVEDLKISLIHSRLLQVLSFLENQKVCSVTMSHCEALWRCLDCDCSFCDGCLSCHAKFTKNHKVVSLSNLRKEDIETMMKKEESCKTHTNQNVGWYCRDCDALICFICLNDHTHDKHDLSSLQEFIINEKEVLLKNLDEIERLTTNEEERKQQEEIAFDVRDYGQKAKENVKKVTKDMVKALVDREQELLDEIQKTITRAERNLRILHHIPAAQDYIQYFAQNGTASEMMEIRDEQSSEKFSYEPFQQDVGGIHFKPNAGLQSQVVSGQGEVALFKKADAKLCLLKVEPDIQAMKTTKLTIVMKTSEEKSANESLDNITIQVTPEEDVQIGEKRRMNVDGEATVDLTVRVPGQVTVHVDVRGNSVSNSPVVMNINPQCIPLKELQLKRDLNIGSNNFNGITMNKTNDRIAVADCSSHCIRVFNMEGDLLLKFGSEGSDHRQYKNPKGLAFLSKTDLVIADNDNHRICILDTVTGKTVKVFGRQGNGNGQLMHPNGVCVDDASNIFVCDYGNHRIQVFSKHGTYLYQFSLPNGKPYDIIKHKGLFYISDCGSSVVYVLGKKNKQLPTTIKTIGGRDCSAVQLNQPRGLAIDSDNNLLVCNGGDSQIYKFTLDGHYIGKTLYRAAVKHPMQTT